MSDWLSKLFVNSTSAQYRQRHTLYSKHIVITVCCPLLKPRILHKFTLTKLHSSHSVDYDDDEDENAVYLTPDQHAAEDDLKTVEEVFADYDDRCTASRPAFTRTDRFDRRSRRWA